MLITNKINIVLAILVSIIPLSIIIGSSVSLTNIILIGFFAIFFLAKKDFLNLLKNREIQLLLLLYLYLIFNSFIAIDFETSANRNFGFIRFILLFISINYLFKNFSNSNLVFNFWFAVIFIVSIDSFIEFYFGRNILGYGELYGERIVSFFKDEPVVGAFLNGFIFIIIGYFFDKSLHKNAKFKLLLFLIILTLFLTVLITGERSNGIKLIIGIAIFVFLNPKLGLKFKIYTSASIFIIFSLLILNSNYVKNRYYDTFIYYLIDKDRLSNYLNNQHYFELYISGIQIFKDYPLLGVGNKNYRVVTIRDAQIKENYEISTHPHQVFFEFLSEHGLVGTLILLSIIFKLMFKNLKIIILSRNSIQLGCLCYLIINFIPLLPSGAFFADFNSTLFWLNLSIMYACNQKTNVFYNK